MKRTVASSPTLSLALLGLALAGLVACAASPLAPPESDQPSDSEYVIGPGDVLQIRVWKSPELSVEVPVRPDGMVSVPLLDDVQAAGLTSTQLKDVVTNEMSEFIESPDVTVVILRMESKRAYVIGEVRQPGAVSLATDMYVTDAISVRGGFTAFADKGNVRVIRRRGGEEREYRFNYDAYTAGRAPGTNFLLAPGDTVIVPD